MSRDIQVLLVSPLPPPSGGIATWTKKYVEYGPNLGIQARVVNIATIGERAKNFSERKSVKTELERTVNILKAMYHQSHVVVPDIIHINTSCSPIGIIRDWLCAVIAPKKSKIVLHCHCNIEDQLGSSRVGRFFFEKVVRKAACILTLNERSAAYVEKTGQTMCKIVPNFIDQTFVREDLKEIRDSVKKVLFTGHIVETKGIFELLQAAEQFPDITFVLAGLIPEETKIDYVPENVQLLGSVSHEKIAELLDESDVFLFPSYTEGFSNSLVEAMARGVPSITTDVGANRDMLEGKGGFIIPCKDAEAVIQAFYRIADREVRTAMSSWNVNKVKRAYLIYPVIASLRSIYEFLLK